MRSGCGARRVLYATFVLCALAVLTFALASCGGDDNGGASPSSAAALITIKTVAGTGTAGFNNDGQPAIAAQLNFPSGAVADTAGNIFIADAGNHRIRRVDAQTGMITTVAGSGLVCTVQPCGDNGPATVARLNAPTGLAVDGGGRLLIADQNNQRVRQVDAQGIITTVAGNGTICSAQPCGDNGAATAAQLNFPTGVAVDSTGNVFIADQSNHRVRRVDFQSRIITTVAGTGAAGFNGDHQPAGTAQLNLPTGVAVDAGGNLLVADQLNHRVRRVDSFGTITSVAGTSNAGFNGDNQAATTADLNVPTGVTVDGAGNLFIADQSNHRVRAVSAQSGIIVTVAGNGTPCLAPTAIPACGDGGVPTSAQLNLPNGVAVVGGGRLLIADLSNHRVRTVGP